MRTMYDAIDASQLPAGAGLYAGYVDGRWPSAGAIAARFPQARIVRIATSPSTDDGVVGDGPPDNGTWPEWVAWVKRRRAAGVDPTLNTDLFLWPAGIAAFKAAGVPQPHWWIAAYVNDPSKPPTTLPAGAVALQWYDFGGYDASLVADYWPGVDPVPAPTRAPQAQPLEEEHMQIEPLSVHPGEYAFAFAPDKQELVLVADGYRLPPASLRIVIWGGDSPSVLEGVQIGGTSGHHTVGHPLPAGCTGVTVRREDAQGYPVGIAFQ